MFAISMGGPWELLIVLAIVLIVFGAGKLPKVMAQMGKGVKAFKDGVANPEDSTPTLETSADSLHHEEIVEAEEVRRS